MIDGFATSHKIYHVGAKVRKWALSPWLAGGAALQALPSNQLHRCYDFSSATRLLSRHFVSCPVSLFLSSDSLPFFVSSFISLKASVRSSRFLAPHFQRSFLPRLISFLFRMSDSKSGEIKEGPTSKVPTCEVAI